MLFGGQGIGLAVIAILLGMSAPAKAGEVVYASLGDTTRSPIGWVEFCAENTSECRGGATQLRDIAVPDIVRWAVEFMEFADGRYPDIAKDIAAEKDLTKKDIKARLQDESQITLQTSDDVHYDDLVHVIDEMIGDGLPNVSVSPMST